MLGQQRNECRKAPEYAASALPIRTALQYAQFWTKDPQLAVKTAEAEMHTDIIAKLC